MHCMICCLFHSKRFWVDTRLYLPALRHVLLAELHPGIMFFAFLTSGEQDSVEFEAASILQPTGELIEVTAVQVKGDPQGMPGALHLVTHWCVCNTHTEMREKLKKKTRNKEGVGVPFLKMKTCKACCITF